MYSIYEIPGVKIGTTKRKPKLRVREQGYINFNLLETHTDPIVAGEREIQLQKEYGYEVDQRHYVNSVNLLSNGRSKRSTDKSAISRRHLTFEQAEEVRAKHIPYKYSMTKLAKEYNTTKAVIKFIIWNKHKVKH